MTTKRTRAARGKPASRGPRIAYWWNEIRKARARERKGDVPFTAEHRKRAADWGLCACGRLDGSVLRYHNLPPELKAPFIMDDSEYAPLDDILEHLGMDFFRAIGNDSIDEAETAMIAIERRVSELRRHPSRIKTSARYQQFARSWKPPKAVTKR